MAALTRLAFAALLLGASQFAAAACNLDQNWEYTNPTAAGCGDVILRYTENDTNNATEIALGYPVPIPVDSLTPVAGFRTYASLLAAQQDMMATHAEVAGYIVGTTVAGRDIWAYRIGTPTDTTIYGQPKGAVMAVGGTHAREWQPPEVIAELFERLVAGRADAGIGQYLSDNLAVILVPVLNVDGFLLTQKFPDTSTADPRVPRDGRMRRKNLRHPAGGAVDDLLTTVDDNMYGVDLNRNHPQGFRSDARNGMERSLIYAGASAHSEPEVDALLDAAALVPAGRLRLFMDVHSFTQVYFAPQTGNAARNARTQELAARMRAVTGNKYRYSPDPQGLEIGTAADHFAVAHEVPSWTLETEPLNGGQDYPGGTGASHSGFITPDSEIPRVRDELARTSLLGFYHQAGPPSVVAAEIRDATGALVWSIDWVPGAPGARTLALRTDGALVAGETYTAWIAFDKPMRWRNGAGVITQYAGQTARLTPSVSLEVATTGANRAIALSGGAWLDAPGPGADGFLNYRDDAYAVEFTLPADLPSAATAAVLVIDTDDLAGQKLDADPATAVDWQGGTWAGYQATVPDCTLRLWVGAVGAAPHSLECTALDDTPPPPPAPAPSGGGGQGGWLCLVALFLAARRALNRSAGRSAPALP
ncbi:MAG: M14 family metallopeptidase [Gammaproteobacteria bacterium]